jgi:hypothetical protein
VACFNAADAYCLVANCGGVHLFSLRLLVFQLWGILARLSNRFPPILITNS